MAVFGVFGICCFLYPTVSNQINESCNESTINEYNHNVNTSSKSAIQAAFERAEQYNEVIAADYFSEEISEYETVLNDYYNILDVDNGIMGTIEIPSINVRLPIYHGESEDVLKKGAAHLEQTSFPIGGRNTRSCISAHSGFPSQIFFDDIDELVAGDDIIVTVYNKKLTYRVCGKEVIGHRVPMFIYKVCGEFEDHPDDNHCQLTLKGEGRFKYAVKADFLYDSRDLNIPGCDVDLDPTHEEGFSLPVYFDRKVLNSFLTDDEYELDFFSESYGDIAKLGTDGWAYEWKIPFGINANDRVVMFLGDLDQIDDDRSIYFLKAYNVPSDHRLVDT